MTEKELIFKLQSLKQIKPNNDWAFSVKAQILKPNVTPVTSPTVWQTFSTVLGLSSQMKMAYAFSVLLFVFAGALGLAQYSLLGDSLFQVKDNAEQLQASLTRETGIKTSLETFKKRSQDLATIVKNNNKEGNKAVALKEANDAAKSLAAAIIKDPSLAKDIVLELKQDGTLAALVDGSGTKETSDIVYKPLLEQLMKDEEGVTSTEERQKIVAEAKALYEKGEFGEALILWVNN